MIVKLIVSWISFAVGINASNVRSPVERLRYISERIVDLLPVSSGCQTEPMKPDDRQSIIDAMVQFVQDEKSELESFVSVLSNARRCGITAAEIDSYKWEVLSALMASPPPSELKKRSAPDAEEDVPNKKIRHVEGIEGVESQPTTVEPTKPRPNLSPGAAKRLMEHLWSYIKEFPREELNDPFWDYLRSVQGMRAANNDLASIKEDVTLLMDMGLAARDIANIFILALSVMRGEVGAPIKVPAMPRQLEAQSRKSLIERLDTLYNNPSFSWTTNNHSRVSLRLADYVKGGTIGVFTNALNLADLAAIPRQRMADIFYKAYKALGGKH